MHFKLLIAFVNDDKTDAVLKSARQSRRDRCHGDQQRPGEG